MADGRSPPSQDIPLEEKYREMIRSNMEELVKDLEPSLLLHYMTGVFRERDIENIRSKNTRAQQACTLLEILPRRGRNAFLNFIETLRKEQPYLVRFVIDETEKEEMNTELNRARAHSGKLRQEVDFIRTGLEKEQQELKKTVRELQDLTKSLQHELLMAKGEDDIQIIKTRVQELENVTKRLDEDKDVYVQEARKMCDQMNEDLRVLKESFENISEEHKELFEKLSHNKSHVPNENHDEEIRFNSSQEEIIVILDRIPNGLELDDTCANLQEQESASLHEQATSPGEPMHCQFEGNQTCSRCHDLEMELDAFRTEMKAEQNKINQLQLKYNDEVQTLEKEKNESIQLIIELEQKIKNLSKEKNKIELQLRDEKAEIKKELTNTEKRLVKAVRKKDCLKKENTDSSQLIEKLNKEKEKLIKEKEALQSQLDTQRNELTRECDQVKAELSSNTKLLRKEVTELQSKCEELQEEIIKSKNFVNRAFLPSGKDFHNCFGVIRTLNTDVNISAKPIATRSSDGPGEASDIFKHRIGTTSGTKETPGSWWRIDLGKNYLLVITHYALRHGRSDGESILQHWQLEGSIDGISWKKLETSHKRDNPNDPPQFSGPDSFVTGKWSVKGKVGAFRSFRILQTGRNSSGKYGIYLSGVELYGILFHV